MNLPRPAPRLFGTDGMRAAFGAPPLDRVTLSALAAALAATLRERNRSPERPRIVLGGDTRESTPEICRWLKAGLAAGGVEVEYAGILPTPGIAHLVGTRGAVSGIAVSASHNPYPDNGVKLLDRTGRKWSDADERAIEERIAEILATGTAPADDDGPNPEADESLRAEYLDHLAATVPNGSGGSSGSGGPGDAGGRPLAGFRVVLDAGNGAASSYAAPLFERLGATATLIHARPDGRNVNAGCGSTAPEEMAARVSATGANLGAAFDGDADRAILADETGTVRDGDAVLYLWATHLKRQGELVPAQIVATSMSNLGLERALAREGIGVVRCDVGDRYVVEAMERHGIVLGGEQSGHIVHSRLSTTGDGLLTALQMAWIAAQAGRPLSDLLAGFRRYPQVLKNVRVRQKADFATLPRVTDAARAVEHRLGDDGRLVLRYSGTEPLARIMIEGPDQPSIDALAEELATVIAGEIGERAERQE
ncbi:MAG: phosphoglucosamine mutase [Acidobacteriota bacterium]|jgi:phosphoglucosamine mutase|nr:phosphoglucosamine mutase [Acidobacteriota bacterium]